ncbi:MAG TPA: RNA polymerase sigma factor SigI [Acidimicrobiales bacterium]|nr:RNA polymerase sigma factor SigI [Acidimicrobiales bacterium]
MSDAPNEAEVSRAWAAHRSHLVDVAFRMLGDIGSAEDVVQEAFSRFARADTAAIEDDRGWLTVVTSRLCLDRIRSAPARRERPHDFTAADGARRAPPASALDPADRVTLDDGVRLALLVVMQQLSPAERVVFVLHDVFGMPFDEIAQSVGRPAATCRQLARRARQRIEADTRGRRFELDAAEHRAVTERFIVAASGGDLHGLLQVLDPDVSGEVDLGAGAATPGVVHGAALVAANLIDFWGRATLVSLPVKGLPAVLAFRRRRLAGVLVLTPTEDSQRVAKVHVLADPAKLAFLRTQLETI